MIFKVTRNEVGILMLSFASVVCGLGNIKVYLPSHVGWLAAFALILVASLTAGGVQIERVRTINIRVFLPWVGFLGAIAFAAVWNGLWFPELSLTVSTLVKMTLMVIATGALIYMRLSPRQVEIVLLATLIVAALGFALALLHNIWLLQYGGGRLGWTWAWAGVLWKTGVCVLPFAVWRAVRAPSGQAFPAILLSVSVIAIDGSRTGLVAVILTIAAASLIGLWRIRSRRTFGGIGVCIFAAGLAYGLVQPSIFWLLHAGQIGRVAAAFIMIALVAWTLASTHSALRLVGRIVATAASLVALVSLVFLAISNANLGTGASPVAAPSAMTESVLLEGGSAAERMLGGDGIRFAMVMNGLRGAYENFPFGAGLGMTTSDAAGTQMHIHMTYLQLISDIGVVGAAFYLMIFGVFVWMYRNTRSSNQMDGVPLLAIILIYLLSGLFAPLSNEISDWFPVLLAFAGVYEFWRKTGRGAATAALAS